MLEMIRKNAVQFGIPMKTAVHMRLRFLKTRIEELQAEVAEHTVLGKADAA